MKLEEVPEHLKYLAQVYGQFVAEYTGATGHRFLGRQNLEEKAAQLELLNEIINKLEVPPQVYMRVVFDQLIGFAKAHGMSYVNMKMLISQAAIDEFRQYERDLAEIYPREDERRAALLGPYEDPFKKAIIDSAQAFSVWLEGIHGEIDEKRALDELEIVARLGQVSDVYLYSSPLITGKDNMPKYIADEIASVKPTFKQQKAIKEARVEVEKKYKGKKWAKWL